MDQAFELTAFLGIHIACGCVNLILQFNATHTEVIHDLF